MPGGLNGRTCPIGGMGSFHSIGKGKWFVLFLIFHSSTLRSYSLDSLVKYPQLRREAVKTKKGGDGQSGPSEVSK